SINKPVFRIGKERSFVDYFVNNVAVSRSHADIVTRGNSCFVVDLNSKNRTFINNRVIPSNFETEIFDGDTLKLGNEEFIFRI
ncbi:MAG: FHA domain-containing protein, partial [Acutalibacteraceae bacterium]|nr:FHA domain-containing protein [Acutalibacteraceae bacterium]